MPAHSSIRYRRHRPLPGCRVPLPFVGAARRGAGWHAGLRTVGRCATVLDVATVFQHRSGLLTRAAATPRRTATSALVLAAMCVMASCTGPSTGSGRQDEESAGNLAETGLSAVGRVFPDAPAVPDGPIAVESREAIERILSVLSGGIVPEEAIAVLGASEDPRVLWFLRDLFRFGTMSSAQEIFRAFTALTGVEPPTRSINEVPDHLIAWDLPAYPGYRDDKRRVFGIIEDGWEPFFADEDSDIDWRLVEWGGVLIDDRLNGSPGVPCFRCIPALDDPPVTPASGGDWYPDERLVFGVVVNGEARAYPRNQMEVHEMVNDTLGGRRIGMPYCTLCLSAQAYFTDDIPGFQPLLRTSGLLSRSNKLMYDLSTYSAIDTFTGQALSGPLHDAGIRLTPISVVTSTWGAWKQAHPDTTIIAQDGGSGRFYPLDPLRGRDDNGPIFPVGDVDPRLPVQERVLGVIAADGTPVAFPVINTSLALQSGRQVVYRGISVELDGDGLRAFVGGRDAASHESFWFAWSQFRPQTEVWQR